MGIFSSKSKKSTRITEQDTAILKLKKQRDQLKIYQKRIYNVLEKDRLLAKQLLKDGKKDRARLLLRKKKYQEGLLTKAEGQLTNIEQLVQDLEFVQIEKQVLDGLKTGNEALKKANDMFSVEEIEVLMDETRESMQKQKEIEDLISGELTEDDEEDVLEELNQLIFEEQEKDNALKLPDTPEAALPDVPTDEISKEDLPNVPEKSKTKSKDKPNEKVALEA